VIEVKEDDMSKQTVKIESTGATIEIEAQYGVKTEFGQTVEDRKVVITTAKVYKAGQIVAELDRYGVERSICPKNRPIILSAMDDCYDELTGTTKAQRDAEQAKKDSDARDYYEHHDAVRKAMNY
jgi:hypothetical protein